MAEAEKERRRMAACVEKLEMGKKELEVSNAKTIEENRRLLDQLEGLNSAVSESDVHIQALNSTLQSTREELQRLTVLAGRTSILEEQLLAMETEQGNLQSKLTSSEENNRSSMQRWMRAERTIGHLHEQIDKIEQEGREERERHVEIVGRMERRTVVEKELESTTGRLKGAAAATSFGRPQTGGTNVVSHFVKDILQDNANLQMGIVELREMLMSSNEEVETLREQMKLHQPLVEYDGISQSRNTLEVELNKKTRLESLPELHVHHHYHRPTKPDGLAKDRTSVHRKPRKKRSIITPSVFSPPSGLQTLQTPKSTDTCPNTPLSAATILSQTSVSIPYLQSPAIPSRWSMESQPNRNSLASSSLPSSPHSGFRNSLVFDSIDNAMDSSRPTTPASSNPRSSIVLPEKQIYDPDVPYRFDSMPAVPRLESVAPQTRSASSQLYNLNSFSEGSDDLGLSLNDSSTILETQERGSTTDSDFSYQNPSSSTITQPIFRPQVRRATSHESLFSMSGIGIDMRTTQRKPSQIFGHHGFTPQISLSQASSQAVMSAATATGRPAFHRRARDTNDYHRSLLSGAGNGTSRSNGGSPQSGSGTAPEKSTSLSKRVGGWMWGKWGVAPAVSTGHLRAKAALSAIDGRKVSSSSFGNKIQEGQGEEPPTTRVLRGQISKSSVVESTAVDKELLKESLGEG